ncbi:SWIM zinc finger family protein [Bacillus cereus]
MFSVHTCNCFFFHYLCSHVYTLLLE